MPNVTGYMLLPREDGNGFELVPKTKARARGRGHTGTRLRPVYSRTFVGNNAIYTKVKDVDQQARIESYRDSCLLENLVKRFEAGDKDAFSGGLSGSYGDFSRELSLRDLHSSVSRVGAYYEALPKNLQNYFGSFKAFLEVASDPNQLSAILASAQKVNDNTEVTDNGTAAE